MLSSERYEAIEELSLQQFYVEIEQRILAYRMLLSRNTIPTSNRLLLDDYRCKILQGEIFFSGDAATLGHELARTYVVNPTTRSHAQFYAKTLALTEATPEIFALSEPEFLSENMKETSLKNLSRITVDIHLEEASTEEILEHLKVLIPQWKR